MDFNLRIQGADKHRINLKYPGTTILHGFLSYAPVTWISHLYKRSDSEIEKCCAAAAVKLRG